MTSRTRSPDNRLHLHTDINRPAKFDEILALVFGLSVFSCKLSIIIDNYRHNGGHVGFFNMGFCCTILSKFHVENEKDLPHRF